MGYDHDECAFCYKEGTDGLDQANEKLFACEFCIKKIATKYSRFYDGITEEEKEYEYGQKCNLCGANKYKGFLISVCDNHYTENKKSFKFEKHPSDILKTYVVFYKNNLLCICSTKKIAKEQIKIHKKNFPDKNDLYGKSDYKIKEKIVI